MAKVAEVVEVAKVAKAVVAAVVVAKTVVLVLVVAMALFPSESLSQPWSSRTRLLFIPHLPLTLPLMLSLTMIVWTTWSTTSSRTTPPLSLT